MFFSKSGTIGNLELKNRWVMAPIKTGYGTLDGRVTERHLRYYENVARGGIGMVILEPVSVTRDGMEHPKQLRIHDEGSVEELRKIVDVLHTHGVRACLNLNHAGRAANPKATGSVVKAPSVLLCPTTGQTPEELTEEEIAGIIRAFGNAVEKAEEAGFDAVEIQCGHGYLISQFLSPRSNRRKDRWGEKRSLFLEEVLHQVDASRGGMAVVLRISSSEFLEGGLGPKDNAPVLKLAEELGFNAIHCGMGNACDTPPFYYAHMAIPDEPQLQALRAIRSMTFLPLIVAGQMAKPEKLRTVELEKLADFIAFGRAIIADPLLPAKLSSGETDNIVSCGFCLQGCLAKVKDGSGLGCIVNPWIDLAPPDPHALSRRNIAVVGSGPAGLSAAASCSLMGADVTLFEKDPELGGQFRLAPMAPHKEAMKRPLEGLISMTKRLVKDIRTGVEADSTALGAFDHVIIATGSKQRIPEIPGLDSQFRITSLEFFEKPDLVRGERILIIGAGMVGVEAAELLSERGFDVTATKRSDTIANDMEMITRKLLLRRLDVRDNVALLPRTEVLAFIPEGVRIRIEGMEETLPSFDTVIIAAGTTPEAEVHELLKARGIDALLIGDARMPADIFSATRSGRIAAEELAALSRGRSEG